MATQLDVTTERLDDVPLLIQVMGEQLGYHRVLDELWPRHGNWLGLSLGQVMVTWLAHILSECRHTMSVVQSWANHRTQVLSQLWNQPLRETDFSDDRLAEVLRVLSLDTVWQPLEQRLNGQMIRAYHLALERVRLDSTTVSVYGGQRIGHEQDPENDRPADAGDAGPEARGGRPVSVLFRRGHSQDHRPDLAQFKVMLASLDPLGLVLAADIVPGNRGDAPLYVPLIDRLRTNLGTAGLLYVGDSKMSALATRAHVQATGNYYLMPLAQIGQVPEAMTNWVAAALTGTVPLTRLQAPDGQTVVGEGYELTRPQHFRSSADGGRVTWRERVFVVRSADHARAVEQAFDTRLARAQAALVRLTPTPTRGRHAAKDQTALRQAVQRVLKEHELVGPSFLTITYVRETLLRPRPRTRRRPAYEEHVGYYRLDVQRNEAVITDYRRGLGWRAYVTNAAASALPLGVAVQVYRDEWLVERNFARLKGRPLSIGPVWLTRDDHAIGLARLLTLAARVLALVEYRARHQLQATHRTLGGLYAGQPKRTTDHPTTERLLGAFKDITLTVMRQGRRVRRHVTPLSKLQLSILRLLGCSRKLYGQFAYDTS